jgi:hypothetical protein
MGLTSMRNNETKAIKASFLTSISCNRKMVISLWSESRSSPFAFHDLTVQEAVNLRMKLDSFILKVAPGEF